MLVHLLPKGVSIAPLPSLVKIEPVSKLQGGLPPVPYRSANRAIVGFHKRSIVRWSAYTKSVRAPSAPKIIR